MKFPALQSLARAFASIRLTVVLLVLSILMVFAATLDQHNKNVASYRQAIKQGGGH